MKKLKIYKIEKNSDSIKGGFWNILGRRVYKGLTYLDIQIGNTIMCDILSGCNETA